MSDSEELNEAQTASDREEEEEEDYDDEPEEKDNDVDSDGSASNFPITPVRDIEEHGTREEEILEEKILEDEDENGENEDGEGEDGEDEDDEGEVKEREDERDSEKETNEEEIESTSPTKTPAASFIILESNTTSMSHGTPLTERSPRILETRDDVFHDDVHVDGPKKLDRMKIDHWSLEQHQPSSIEFNPANAVIAAGTISGKMEILQEKFNASQKVTPQPIPHNGKIRDGRIEKFEMLQQKGYDGSDQKPKEMIVVTKGRASGIKEMIEKGKQDHDDGDGGCLSLPQQKTRRKMADDWLTKIKHSAQVSSETKILATPTDSGARNVWKKLEESLNMSSHQPLMGSEETKSIIKVGKLKLDEKEAIFGGRASAEKPQRDYDSVYSSVEVKRTPSYKTYHKDGSLTSTPNVVSYTKAGVKTDTKVTLISNYSNVSKDDPYRGIDRYGLIKMVGDLKRKVESLEEENKNLKNIQDGNKCSEKDGDEKLNGHTSDESLEPLKRLKLSSHFQSDATGVGCD